MTLGVGVGVREDDFTVTGTDFHDRGLRFDRQLTDLGRIWSGDATVGASPTRTGGPRLLIGGRADLAAPRAARHGAGWTMAIGGPEQLADGVAQVHEQWAEVGRTDRRYVMAMLYTAVGPDADDLAAGAIGSYYAWLGPNLVGWVLGTCAVGENALAARIAEFAAAGADELMLTPCTADLDQLHRIADVAMDAAFATPKGLI
jgi:alkanesulfonate monooxygenase SsuD/methylene tetrahydromethanopterin reductase-like flavin-dependent oxidoreductase (luciferase family)